jgi:hypothetical protein
MADVEEDIESQASDDSEDSIALSSTWSKDDFSSNAKAWYALNDSLEQEQRQYTNARKPRVKRQRELKKNIMEYMHANNTTLQYKGRILSVEEVISSNPINKKKLLPAAEDYFIKRGGSSVQSSSSAADISKHIISFMGEKSTLKLVEQVSEEEKVRVKRAKTDELKQKRAELKEAKRRIADAAARGLPADPNDVAMIQ